MKPRACSNTSLWARLETGKPLLVSWSMIPSSLSTEVFARGPFEACCIDLQHGYSGYSDFFAMAAPVEAAGKPLIVRMPLEDWGFAARAMDAGAQAIICPMVNNAADAEKLVEVTKFPPIGQRSFGAYRDAGAKGARDKGHLAQLNHANLTFALIETRTAIENLDAICATEGLDGVFVGPFDLSVSLTNGKGPIEPAGEMVLEALVVIAAKSVEHGVFAGIYAASADDARAYIERGYQIIALGNDIGYLAEASAAAHKAV
jgi:4-hydroxy-2-oxoheptanedioate aldolase